MRRRTHATEDRIETGDYGDVDSKKRRSNFDRRRFVLVSVACVALIWGLVALARPSVGTVFKNRYLKSGPVIIGFAEEVEESSDFILPRLHPGDITPFVWKEDEKIADEHGRLIGMPPELTQEIYKFCEESGLLEQFWHLAYNDSMDFDKSKILPLKGGRKWTATTPEITGNWRKSDIHWIDALDEENFEETLQVLSRGNFDTVLDAIGRDFQSDGLMVAGMGFIMTSYNSKAYIHADLDDSGGFWWDLLFPLILPKHYKATLTIGDDEDDERRDDLPFTPNIGFLLGGDTSHATGECDFRSKEEIRVAVSVYIIDVNKQNVELISSDSTALFPIPNQVDWFLAQKGRLWGKGNSLKKDKGRHALTAKDKAPDKCPELARQGKCKDLWGVRMQCLKSCGVYIDNDRYFSEFFPRTR